ncbi:polysaccharide deacetylase family protein [Aurantiacibacter aquimixticola]|uniref:Chitooligosaccharide deacetylase n=1 Tax=Aurantiacibacter aquimixticola TaxID=1958945 RepID=A0A419RW98_9SPHN|nr:polysaccharide deacetylase family protein [Aurantiacibacter aquimixticola]RJY10034.1 polysaccharide deacetylase [Aurantiacibacter aquimixticola]
MSLDPGYLEYSDRHEGYDHHIYEWSNIHERAPVRWPGDKSVAVFLCVSLEWFPIVPDGPFKAPGHMLTPYPDYRHYTVRDYGNRVGVWRMLEAFESADVKASFATNAAVAERYPELIAAVQAGGHEIIAHSTDMNGTIDSSLDEEVERALVSNALARLEAATGAKPRGWLSIARSQSWHTLDLLAEHGIGYCCDWVNDELPYRFANGVVDLPLSAELSDRTIIATQQHSAEAWGGMMRDAFDFLAGEAASQGSARLLPMELTPYIIGQPFRIEALENLLADLAGRDQAWFATGSEIVESWAGQQ